MNGVVDITVDGVKHTLRFGMHGCMEFERLVYIKPSANAAKLLTDMVHGGRFGQAMWEGEAEPDYHHSVRLLEALSEQDDYIPQITKMQNTYEESKFGKEFIAKYAKIKKKIDELNK